MKTILFEWKKMRKLRLFAALAVATFLLITGLYIRNVLQQELIPVKKTEYFSKFLLEVSQQNDTDQQTLQKQDDPETGKRLEIGEKLAGALTELQTAIDKREGQAELKLENQVYQLAVKYKEKLGTFPLSQQEMEDIARLNDELEKRNLVKEDEDLSIAQPLFMKKAVGLLVSPVGFLIAVLLIGAAFTKEWDDHSMQFNRALPASSVERITGRLVSYWLVSLVWLVLVYGLSFLLPYAGGHTDNALFRYPFSSPEGVFIEAADLLVNAAIYSALFLLASFSIFLFAGSLLRNTVMTVLLAAVLLFGGWIVTAGGGMAAWNPFTYLQPVEAAARRESLSIVGVLVLIGFAIGGTVLAFIADERRALS